MEYRISQGWRIAAIIFSFLFIVGGFAFLLSPWYDGNMHKAPVLAVLVGAAFMALGWVAWVESIKGKIIIDSISITQEGAFTRKSLLLTEIKGYRKEKERIFLVPETGKPIQISSYVENLGELKTWIEERYPDVDQLAVERETDEIVADEHFGVTEDERVRRLAQASTVTKAISAVAVAASIWLFVYPKPYQLAWALVLAVPLAGLYIVWHYKGLVTVNDTKKSAYPSMLAALLMPGIVACARALIDYEIYAYTKLWQYTAGITAVLTTVTWFIAYTGYPKNINKKPMIFALAVVFAAYGFGAAVFTNCHFDTSYPTVFTEKVAGMYINSGKTTTYYLTVGPWGQYTNDQQLSVPKALYNSVQTGDSINIFLQQGKLGIPWYFAEKKETGPPPAQTTQ